LEEWTVGKGKSGEPQRRVPLWLKAFYSLFVLVLVPVYWDAYGLLHFLWFSDIALLLALVALWRESALVAGMAALAVLLPELGWNVAFFARLLGGVDLFGVVHYMFDPELSLLLRGLSLFHVFLPPLLLFLVHRLRYEPRAFAAQLVLLWIVLPVTYLFTDPEKNINFVFGFGGDPAGPGHLLLLMIAVPLLVYLPTHLLLKKFFS
jgi:hypothetical protein